MGLRSKLQVYQQLFIAFLCFQMDKSHFGLDETRALVDIVGEFVHQKSSYTDKKKIFSKKVWDEIFETFNAKHPGHSRRSVQSRWDRLKASYNSWASLQLPASGCDASGSFSPEVEERRKVQREDLKKKALLVQGCGCIDVLESILEGRRATGDQSVFHGESIVREIRTEGAETDGGDEMLRGEDEDEDIMHAPPSKESVQSSRSVSSFRRGSPKNTKKRKRVNELSRIADTFDKMVEMMDEKYDSLIRNLFHPERGER